MGRREDISSPNRLGNLVSIEPLCFLGAPLKLLLEKLRAKYGVVVVTEHSTGRREPLQVGPVQALGKDWSLAPQSFML